VVVAEGEEGLQGLVNGWLDNVGKLLCIAACLPARIYE
jgi:hypothetical protein